MKRKLLLCSAVIAVFCLLGFGATAQDVARSPVRTLKPGQVARVGESVITAEQLIQRMVEAQRMPPYAVTVDGVLTVMLAERLLELEAARVGADLKPREVQADVDKYYAQAQAEFEAEARELAAEQRRQKQPEVPLKWDEWLKLRTGLTDAQFTGLLRMRVRNDLLKRLVIWHWFVSSRTIDVKLIRCSRKDKVESVLQKISAGADFDTLVVAHSEMPNPNQKDPGRVSQVVANDGTLTAEVDKAAWELKDGAISGAIESEGAWYIVKRIQVSIPNEARFFDLRESLLAKPNINDNMLERWRRAVTASGRYVVERRVPGVDCEADQ